MAEAQEQIPISDELFKLMRDAAAHSRRMEERFVSSYALLLALMDDPIVGSALVDVIDREKLEGLYAIRRAERARVLAAAAEAAQAQVGEDVRGGRREEQIEDPRRIADALPEPPGSHGEAPPMQRYDTLAFRCGEGSELTWLSHEAFAIFTEGARRADGRLMPHHIGIGFAAEAVRSPGVLAQLRVEPGKVTDALFKL
ncbi:MAG TPA: hypothetical protein VMV73_05500 [Candidatus Dormibacteraeota bacterium]|nr:hypothetical protein [Candidatus Dormibacteraeota bacterium]